MKIISRKDLEKLIGELIAEQRVPGEATARSEQAYRRNSPAGTRRRSDKGLNTARRRRDRDEINWALMDADGDGDLDIVNMGPSGQKAEIRDILVAAGIIDSATFDSLASDEYFEDPKWGQKRRHGGRRGFMTDLAWQIASGEEKRLSPEAEARLIELDPEWGDLLDTFDDEVLDQMRRDEFADGEDLRLSDSEAQARFSESKETRMSNDFGRNDIKAWFAQTLYEDFETSKPRKRRSTGILTEATEDERDVKVDDYDEYLIMISNALVLGIEALFGRDLSEDDEYELGQDFRRELEGHPDLTNKLAKHFESFRMGSSHPEPSEAEYGSHIDFTAADRIKLLDQVASKIYDAMDSADLNRNSLDELVRAMSRAKEIDINDWEISNFDFDEVRDRVVKFEEEAAEAGYTGL